MEKQIDDRPLMVSIRCAVYNHEPYLQQCLDGFVMQKTNFRFEAIVHDDASTDNSAAIIREYAEKYPDIIKPIIETENQYSKHDGSLQRVMDEACKGKYIACCEGDDYWTDPLKLQKQVDALEAHPECTICFGNVRVISNDGEYLNWNIPVNQSIKQGVIKLGDYTKEQLAKRRWTFHTSSYVYRASLIEGYGAIMRGEFKDFPYGDLPIVLYCLMKGNGFYVKDELSCYRWQANGSWSQKFITNGDYAIQVAKNLTKGLKAFDKLTNYKYHQDIQYRIIQQSFRIDEVNNNVFHMFHVKYWKLYDKKTIKYLFSLLLHKYCPSIWSFLKNE